MQEHGLDAWLKGTEITDDQRAALHRVSDMIASRYPNPDDSFHVGEIAFITAAQIILGDVTLTEVAVAWARPLGSARPCSGIHRPDSSALPS